MVSNTYEILSVIGDSWAPVFVAWCIAAAVGILFFMGADSRRD
jgi:hypothetical protein